MSPFLMASPRTPTEVGWLKHKSGQCAHARNSWVCSQADQPIATKFTFLSSSNNQQQAALWATKYIYQPFGLLTYISIPEGC